MTQTVLSVNYLPVFGLLVMYENICKQYWEDPPCLVKYLLYLLHSLTGLCYLHCLMLTVLYQTSIYFMLHLRVNTLRLVQWPWNSLTSGALLKVILTMMESLCNASSSPVTGSHSTCITINTSVILLIFKLRCSQLHISVQLLSEESWIPCFYFLTR